MSSSTSSSEHDRTEPATQFKLDEARKQGQVAKSLDVNSLIMVFAFLCTLLLLAAKAWKQMSLTSENLFLSAGQYAGDGESVLSALAQETKTYWSVLLTPLCVGVVAAIAGNILQTGPIFSGEPLKPKFERLNPVAGFKRVFNKRMLFEGLKSIVKLLILVVVAYSVFSSRWQQLQSIVLLSAREQMAWFADVTVALLFRLVMALAVIALIDFAFTRFQFAQRMRMSRRDMKEEVKRREGDPLIRSKIRQLQKENLKQSRSMSKVKEADVLITNPTHYAVALRYVRGEMSAPHVISKGSDRWAQDMKQLAYRHDVPVLERKQLARQLFRQGVVDRPVPVDTFIDVARLYADIAERRRVRMNRAEVRT